MRRTRQHGSRRRIRLISLATALGVLLFGTVSAPRDARAEDESATQPLSPLEERAQRVELLKKLYKVDRSGVRPAPAQAAESASAPQPRPANPQLRRPID